MSSHWIAHDGGPLSLAVVSSPSLTPEVASWFERRTFLESRPLETLLADKIEAGHRVGVGIPALNEAATIGDICTAIRSLMNGDRPLVDRLVVVDSGSTDATPQVARDAGAEVFEGVSDDAADGGKGAALHKSLQVLDDCEVIVWVDADVSNFGAHFVTDLLDPLFKDPDILLVKGFYERPLRTDSGLHQGGARVTELAARPLINLLCPELSGIVQPLAGECAFRRSAVEGIRLFSGYGVDIGLIIDIFDQHGLDAIAQADLGTRVHDNKELPALGRMAHQVVQAMLARFEQQGRIKLHDEPSGALIQFDGLEPIASDLQISEMSPIESRKSS
jgi:glucosyl-3-phosphoglycerate synthase